LIAVVGSLAPLTTFANPDFGTEALGDVRGFDVFRPGEIGSGAVGSQQSQYRRVIFSAV